MSGILGGDSTSKAPSSGGGGGILGGKSSAITTSSPITHKPTINGNLEMNDVMGSLDRSARLENEYAAQKESARNIPILGTVLKGLDKAGEFIEENPVTHFITQTGRDLVSMGPVGTSQALYGQAENILGRYLPKLVTRPTIATKIGGEAAKEALVGIPLGTGQTLASNPEANLKDLAIGGILGGGGGALLGGGAMAIGQGLKAGAKASTKNIINSLTENVVRNASELPSRTVESPFTKGTIDNPVSRGYTENVGRTFGNGLSRVADDIAPSRVIQPPSSGSLVSNAETIGGRPITEPVIPQAPQILNRSNTLNQLDNGNFSDELNSMIRNSDNTYERATNVESVAKANENLKNLPEAETKFLLNESGGSDHIATGYRLMQELDAVGEHGRALVVSQKLARDLTRSGQTSQAASILERMSPEGQLLNLVRTAERNGKVVTEADSIKFKELASKVQEKSGAGIRSNQFNEILNRLEKGENVGVDDIKKLSNFLSGAEKVARPKVIKVVDDIPAELKEPRKREKVISFLEEAEQAALARIAGRRNNLNSLPFPEWKDHTIVVASQLAKGTIKAATHVEDLVRMFGEQIRPVATEVFQNAQKLLKTSSSNVGEGDIAKANEALRKVTGEKQPIADKIVEKYVRENDKVSKKDIDTLRELAKKVTKLSGDQKVNADIEMQKILNSYEKSSPWDKVNAIRYIAMLLNSGTQSVNAISGPLMALTGYLTDILGTMIKPSSTTLYGSNPLRFMAGYLKNAKVGVKAGFHGVNPAGIHGTNDIRGLTYKGKYNPLSWLERGLGAVAKGADYATYKTVFDSEMVKQGYLDARKQGVKGKENIKRHIESFINDPPETALEQADRIGKNTTFQRSDSLGGQAANALQSGGPKIQKYLKPVVQTIFPFVRTPVNIASTAVTLTPAGVIKGLYQLTSNSPASQREAIRSLSLSLTGTGGLGALGYYLNQIGIITGANDSGDKDVDSIREQAGKGKYRFNTSALQRYLSAMLDGEGFEAAEKAAQYQKGDSAFDYNRFQPLAFPLAGGASLSENKGKPALGRAMSVLSDSAGSLLGMSSVRGLQDTFQPQYGGTQGEKTTGIVMRLGESFFKSFSPSALAQEARRQDPIARKISNNGNPYQDVKEYYKSRTPGFGLSQSLPPLKTTLGISKQNAPGIIGQYANPYKSEVAPYTDAAKFISDLIDRTGDNSLAPSAPEKKVTGKDKLGKHVSMPIPPDRYAQLQEEVGNEIIKKVLTLSPALSDAKKAEKLKVIYSDAKSKYRDKVKKELGVR